MCAEHKSSEVKVKERSSASLVRTDRTTKSHKGRTSLECRRLSPLFKVELRYPAMSSLIGLGKAQQVAALQKFVCFRGHLIEIHETNSFPGRHGKGRYLLLPLGWRHRIELR